MDHNVEFLSNELLDGPLSFDELLIQSKSSTFPHVYQGVEMFPYLRSGDILVVDTSLTPKHGSLIICFINGERLVRWLSKKPRPVLLPDNKKYRPIMITGEVEFKVFGIVTAVVRRREE